MRSLLFVPGDSERKQARCLESKADALILDLEDSVAPPQKPVARVMVAAFLRRTASAPQRPLLYVRVNALDTGETEADLTAIMDGRPDGVLLPKTIGGASLKDLCARLTAHERRVGIVEGSTRILPVATETASAVLALPTVPGSTARLSGLTWGGEDLAADIGAEANHDESGNYTAPYVMARSMALLTAVAAACAPIETAFTNYTNPEAFRADCLRSRRDGFTGRIAIHPSQVDTINEIFTPSADVVAHSRKIVEAFRANPGLGVIGIDGEMIDMPHLRQAERILRRHEALEALRRR